MACLASSLFAGGCNTGSPQENVSPLQDEPTTPVDPARHTNTDTHTSTSTSTPEKTLVTDNEEALTELLGRFDAAISGLYADPLAAGDDNHPLTVAWLDVVIGGSQLDRQVRGRILASGTEDGMRIVPDADGTSFTDVALGLTEEPDGSLTWTNCGYAPGVGVDLHTGEVLDDNRTSTRGRGRAVRGADGTLSISELWDDESYRLAPGEPDPCIALADHTGGGSR
jgi:hypothetical protein